jgi:hypothetical protein
LVTLAALTGDLAWVPAEAAAVGFGSALGRFSS